jgi:CRISPR-associated exonuclease Cas4
MSPVLLILLSALLIATAVVLKIHSRKAREKSGIPRGRLIHADSKLMKVQKTLFSQRLMLAGKPDAVIMRDGECIPVEIKIREPPKSPYESHIMQLAAYCFLLEENGYRVTRGIILYRGKKTQREFVIDYSTELKAKLILAVEDIRNLKSRPPRIFDIKCDFCSLKKQCEELEKREKTERGDTA